MHHVGPLYDIKRDGKPFRIMVSGAEYGRKEGPFSVEERTEVIKDLDPTNPHMNGTLCLLQMLFGEQPNNDILKTNVNDEQHSILRCFSLANFLLCSAPWGEYSAQAFTKKMLKNCSEHYQKTIEILQPQIIVLQGTRAREFFLGRYDIDLNYRTPRIRNDSSLRKKHFSFAFMSSQLSTERMGRGKLQGDN